MQIVFYVADFFIVKLFLSSKYSLHEYFSNGFSIHLNDSSYLNHTCGDFFCLFSGLFSTNPLGFLLLLTKLNCILTYIVGNKRSECLIWKHSNFGSPENLKEIKNVTKLTHTCNHTYC